MTSSGNPLIPLFVLIGVAALVLWRNRKPQDLKISNLLIRPVMILVGATLFLTFVARPTTVLEALGVVVALALGAALGWQRGKLTRLDIHPETQSLMAHTSPLGTVMLLGLVVLRYGLGWVSRQYPNLLPVSPIQLTAWLLCLWVGFLCLQSLEIWLRARRTLASATSATA